MRWNLTIIQFKLTVKTLFKTFFTFSALLARSPSQPNHDLRRFSHPSGSVRARDPDLTRLFNALNLFLPQMGDLWKVVMEHSVGQPHPA